MFNDDNEPGIYLSTGPLTYKRKDAWTNKTKSFDMQLTYDQTITRQEKEFPQVDNVNDKNRLKFELQTLTRNVAPKGATRLSYIPSIELFGVFKLEMTSQDDKNQKFVVYFRVDTAIADFPHHISQGNILKRYPVYLKAFVKYSLDGDFKNVPILLETAFMQIDRPSLIGNICVLFTSLGLDIQEKIEEKTGDKCFFPCSDNSKFFWNLVNRMITYTSKKTSEMLNPPPPTASE
jgi:hypothetical protein